MPSAVAGFLILAARRLPGWDSYERPVAADLKTSAQALARAQMLTGKSVTASLHRAVPGFLQRAYGVLFRPAPQISDTVVKKTARLDSIDFSFRVGTKGSWLP